MTCTVCTVHVRVTLCRTVHHVTIDTLFPTPFSEEVPSPVDGPSPLQINADSAVAGAGLLVHEALKGTHRDADWHRLLAAHD